MYDQEKIALSDTSRAFVTPIVGGLAAGSIAYGLPAAVDKVRDVRIRKNRDKYIKAMKEVHPDLRGMDKKDLHIAYNSLSMHAPHVLKDPLLGGQELLRMTRYRQADLNSLNEMNKLRGTSMVDQAFMNATNFVASGIGEGFKGYQAQRNADADQKYREKMDKFRMEMDQAKFDLEKQRMRTQGEQFAETHGQKERQFEASFNQRNEQQAQNMQVRATEFGYRQDEDARAEARWQVEQGTREMTNKLKQIELAQKEIKQERALDANNLPMTDDKGRAVFYSQPGVSVNTITGRLPSAQSPNPVPLQQGTGSKRRKDRQLKTKPMTQYASASNSLNLFDPDSVATPQAKTASAEYMYDIVARLRDRNL